MMLLVVAFYVQCVLPATKITEGACSSLEVN
jgi:hypothetical protein